MWILKFNAVNFSICIFLFFERHQSFDDISIILKKNNDIVHPAKCEVGASLINGILISR